MSGPPMFHDARYDDPRLLRAQADTERQRSNARDGQADVRRLELRLRQIASNPHLPGEELAAMARAALLSSGIVV